MIFIFGIHFQIYSYLPIVQTDIFGLNVSFGQTMYPIYFLSDILYHVERKDTWP